MVVKETQKRIVDGKEICTITEKEVPPDSARLALYLRNRMPEKYNRDKQSIDFNFIKQESLTAEECRQILLNDPFLNPPIVTYEEY